MSKVKAANPVVELDGDEMTRIIWAFIKDKLILPYPDIDLKYYDPPVQNRDETGDQITAESGAMTKDLAILVGPDHAWQTTIQFLDTIDENLKAAMV